MPVMRARVLALFWVALFCVLMGAAGAQSPAENPVVKACQEIGFKGLSKAAAPSASPLTYKLGPRTYIKKYLAELFEAESDRKAFEEAVTAVIDSLEEEAAKTKRNNDGAYALAMATSILYSLAKDEEVGDESVDALYERFKATFDTAAVKAASNAQKQEFAEWALVQSSLTLLVATQSTSDADLTKLRTMAKAQLLNLFGVSADAWTIKGKTITLKTSAVVPTEPTPAGKGLAAGFTFTPPGDWKKEGVWHTFRWKEKETDTTTLSTLIRMTDAVPMKGNVGDALRETWKTVMPKEAEGKHGAMVFRRYVGDGLVANFIFGRVRETGRQADTLFTLYLVDCGTSWQPVVVAQTYEDSSPWSAGVDFSAQYSYPRTADFAEKFLEGLRCPSAKGKAMVDMASVAGDYHFGSSANLQWVNIYTGSTTMTFVSSGGELSLKPNGTFTWTYSSASGAVGATTFRGAKGTGTWAIAKDQLICTFKTYDQGDGYQVKEKRYRIGGLVVFPDGEKIVVLRSELDKPINPITVSDSSDYYTTKKK